MRKIALFLYGEYIFFAIVNESRLYFCKDLLVEHEFPYEDVCRGF